MQTAIDPMNVKLADLEVLEAQQPRILAPVEPRQDDVPPISKHDLRHQFIGVLRMINHLTGGDMRQQIDSIDFLVRRIDLLEEQNAKLRQKAEADLVEQKEAFEAEKLGYQKQVKDMRQVLRSIALVMDGQVDPFELKPSSKWSKAELGQWIIAAVENMNWARQRVDNYIDPKNAVPIAPDPE